MACTNKLIDPGTDEPYETGWLCGKEGERCPICQETEAARWLDHFGGPERFEREAEARAFYAEFGVMPL